MVQPHEIEGIIDTQVAQKTCRKEYLWYLVKWKNHPIEDNLWLDVAQIHKVGYSVEGLMDWSHDFLLPQEPNTVASAWQGKDKRKGDRVSEEDEEIHSLDG